MKTPAIRHALRSVLSFFRTNIVFILLLVAVEILLFSQNYTPGTYLVGWDTTMPEFNIPLNLTRSVFSIWQEYRGLGLLDGMAHAANILHTVYIWLLSLFLPQNALRYSFIHLNHALGGITMFFLLYRLFRHTPLGFIGALFYMLNIGIIQQFYAPLEVFTVHFIALPLITLLMINVFKSSTRKNYLFLFLGALAVSPQGFVPTVFIAFLVLFFSLLASHLFYTKRVKEALMLGAIVFAANAFWLIPYAYSALYTPQVIRQAKINQFSSEEIFYRNKAHGDMWSVLNLSGFMLDTIEMDAVTTKDVFFMQQWREHIQQPLYQIIFVGFILTMLTGIIATVKHREHMLVPFLLAGGTACFFLANNTPGLEQLNNLLRATVPIIGEAFRFPFTKFITLFAFCFSLFLTYGFLRLYLYIQTEHHDKTASRLNRIRQVLKRSSHILSPLTLTILMLAIFFLALPAFSGYFTSPFVRLAIPKEYDDVFSYFTAIPENNRVAMLPVHTFWNWQYRDWQFRGSGFHWFGIPQPTLHRAFDPWSNLNEQVYNELSYTMERNDTAAFERVLQKYDIKYLLLDRHTLNAVTKKPIDYNRIESFLLSSGTIRKEKTFGKIDIFASSLDTSWVKTIPEENVITVYPPSTYANEDTLITDFPIYSNRTEMPDIISPFSSFYTEKLQENHAFTVHETDEAFEISPAVDLPIALNRHELVVPPITDEFLIPVDVTPVEEGFLLTPTYPLITLNDTPVALPRASVLYKVIMKEPEAIVFKDINHSLPVSTEHPMQTYLLRNQVNTLLIQKNELEEVLYVDPSLFAQEELTIPIEAPELSSFVITVPKIGGPFSQQNVVTSGTYKTLLREEDSLGTTAYSYRKTELMKDGLRLEARKSSSEVAFYHSKLPHQGSYIVQVTAEQHAGLPATFYVDNLIQGRAEHDSKLSRTGQDNYFIIPPTESFFQGYGFHIYVRSVGKETAQTTIKGVAYYPFPETWAKNIRLKKTAFEAFSADTGTPIEFKKTNNALYTALVAKQTDTLLILSQAFDRSWHAYTVGSDVSWWEAAFPFIFGKSLTEHRIINNWKNGWTVPGDSDSAHTYVVLVFLPQYLQYIGTSITVGAALWLGISEIHTSRKKQK